MWFSVPSAHFRYLTLYTKKCAHVRACRHGAENKVRLKAQLTPPPLDVARVSTRVCVCVYVGDEPTMTTASAFNEVQWHISTVMWNAIAVSSNSIKRNWGRSGAVELEQLLRCDPDSVGCFVLHLQIVCKRIVWMQCPGVSGNPGESGKTGVTVEKDTSTIAYDGYYGLSIISDLFNWFLHTNKQIFIIQKYDIFIHLICMKKWSPYVTNLFF